jgi:hypothetical protein
MIELVDNEHVWNRPVYFEVHWIRLHLLVSFHHYS